MGKKIDLTGQRFGRLIVVEEAYISRKPDGQIVRNFTCLCECGNKSVVTYTNLIYGNSRSCGCIKSAMATQHMLEINKIGLLDGTNVNKLTQKISKNNTSGHKGVSWESKKKKWAASLNIKGVRVLYKCFDNIQDAINARKEAEEKYFKPILEKYGKEE